MPPRLRLVTHSGIQASKFVAWVMRVPAVSDVEYGEWIRSKRTSCVNQVVVDLDLRPVFEYSFKAGFGLISRLGHGVRFICVGRYRILRAHVSQSFHPLLDHHSSGKVTYWEPHKPQTNALQEMRKGIIVPVTIALRSFLLILLHILLPPFAPLQLLNSALDAREHDVGEHIARRMRKDEHGVAKFEHGQQEPSALRGELLRLARGGRLRLIPLAGSCIAGDVLDRTARRRLRVRGWCVSATSCDGDVGG
jgi:hypothetical protein